MFYSMNCMHATMCCFHFHLLLLLLLFSFVYQQICCECFVVLGHTYLHILVFPYREEEICLDGVEVFFVIVFQLFFLNVFFYSSSSSFVGVSLEE